GVPRRMDRAGGRPRIPGRHPDRRGRRPAAARAGRRRRAADRRPPRRRPGARARRHRGRSRRRHLGRGAELPAPLRGPRRPAAPLRSRLVPAVERLPHRRWRPHRAAGPVRAGDGGGRAGAGPRDHRQGRGPGRLAVRHRRRHRRPGHDRGGRHPGEPPLHPVGQGVRHLLQHRPGPGDPGRAGRRHPRVAPHRHRPQRRDDRGRHPGRHDVRPGLPRGVLHRRPHAPARHGDLHRHPGGRGHRGRRHGPGGRGARRHAHPSGPARGAPHRDRGPGGQPGGARL
ncbi:MAG: 5-carboxymethyl-2-oxo-hex-3- ene-1,7-dioate decarboxylase / 2-hydroxyhepta-2,4-diene-1,7-dioate isomerase, partial [uncultured Corynebacteriales bacterium]